MPKIITKANPGICGLLSTITAVSDDGMTAQISITSDCPDIIKLGDEIKEIDGMQEVFKPFGQSIIFTEAAKFCSHATCPLPTAILKTVEAACGYALPADVQIKISKEE